MKDMIQKDREHARRSNRARSTRGRWSIKDNNNELQSKFH